jgi:dihydroneopterin aldolase
VNGKLRRSIETLAREVAAELGAEFLDIEVKKHLRIRFRRADGREVTATASKTPRCDEHSLNFARQQFRRVILNSP